jgi:RimJ/RimL family protein N-acetyltransferase
MSIRLADFTEGDIDRLVEWVASREILRQRAGSAFTYPLTRETMVSHLQRAGQQGDRRIFKALNLVAEEPIGHIELGAIDREHRIARVGRVFVAPEHRGRRYGSQMVHAVVEMAFGELQLQRLELSVFDFNLPAVACYERVGFRRESAGREIYGTPGGYWTEIVMVALATEWSARLSESSDLDAVSDPAPDNGLQGTRGYP